MIKRINKKIIIPIIIILLIAFYIFYKNKNAYNEFEIVSNTDELVPYDETQNTEDIENESELEQENINLDNLEENVKMIKVHITGNIKNEGVFELEEGSRIVDAVDKAGGFTEEADSSKVNLAYILSDGIKIYIPSISDESDTTMEYITKDSGKNVVTDETRIQKVNNSLVNINKATQTELETLPGIGPSIALKIISYREEEGNFLNIEDIKNVSGIGDSKFKKIKELICV